jgi:hypothetical protein
MKKQPLIISLIILAGITSSGLAYAVTNGSIITGDLTVTGTCTGCSGEADFTTWTLITNQTVSGTSAIFPFNTAIGNNEISYVGGSGKAYLIDSNGVLKGATNFNIASIGTQLVQSASGEYKVLQDDNGTVTIFKNSAKLQTINADTTHSFSAATNLLTTISPNGKYVLLTGTDINGVNEHIQIWGGS